METGIRFEYEPGRKRTGAEVSMKRQDRANPTVWLPERLQRRPEEGAP